MKYFSRIHNVKGAVTTFNNRIDLDTALKERGMDGLYGRSEKAAEQKELHAFLVKKAMEKGEQQTKMEAAEGKMFNREDMKKI